MARLGIKIPHPEIIIVNTIIFLNFIFFSIVINNAETKTALTMESILGIMENEDKSISLFRITAINSTNGKNPTEYLKRAFMLEIGLVKQSSIPSYAGGYFVCHIK